MKYIVGEPRNILPRDTTIFFFVFDDIEKYNEISGSMTLTVGAIIEFANETRDDTRAIDSAELSLKKASYSGPSMPGKKHAVPAIAANEATLKWRT